MVSYGPVPRLYARIQSIVKTAGKCVESSGRPTQYAPIGRPAKIYIGLCVSSGVGVRAVEIRSDFIFLPIDMCTACFAVCIPKKHGRLMPEYFKNVGFRRPAAHHFRLAALCRFCVKIRQTKLKQPDLVTGPDFEDIELV